jgi:hypothetical protein
MQAAKLNIKTFRITCRYWRYSQNKIKTGRQISANNESNENFSGVHDAEPS